MSQVIPHPTPKFNVQHYGPHEKNTVLPYSRRDYFKIWVVDCESMLHYANRSVHITQPALIFSHPLVPYSFETIQKRMWGYMCIFTDDFIKGSHNTEGILQSPLFRIGSESVFFLDEEKLRYVSSLYDRMLQEIGTDYLYKYDVIRSLVDLLVHEALKMQPALTAVRHHNAGTRISSLFLELLERQFPIDSPQRILSLKKPADYAYHLSVHVNHLNHAVREATGKTTTHHIHERVVNEARALLKNTDWSVSDIAYSLGFDYPTYFNNFFKKNTGHTPLSLRK